MLNYVAEFLEIVLLFLIIKAVVTDVISLLSPLLLCFECGPES